MCETIKQVYCAHSSCPFILASVAEEEMARFGGMSKAALAGDDAPRGCSVTSRSGACSFIRLDTGQ